MVKDSSLLEVVAKSHGFVWYFLFARAPFRPGGHLVHKRLTRCSNSRDPCNPRVLRNRLLHMRFVSLLFFCLSAFAASPVRLLDTAPIRFEPNLGQLGRPAL